MNIQFGNNGLLPAPHLATKSDRRRFRKGTKQIEAEMRRIEGELKNLKNIATTPSSQNGQLRTPEGEHISFNLNQGFLSTDQFEVQADSRSSKKQGNPVFQISDKTGFQTPPKEVKTPRLFSLRLRQNGSVFSKKYSRLGLEDQNVRANVRCKKRDFIASSKSPLSLSEIERTLNWLSQINPVALLGEHIKSTVEKAKIAIKAKMAEPGTSIPTHVFGNNEEPIILPFAKVG